MVHFNQELEELLGDFASPIRQAQPALELNSVWAGCLVTQLVQDGSPDPQKQSQSRNKDVIGHTGITDIANIANKPISADTVSTNYVNVSTAYVKHLQMNF